MAEDEKPTPLPPGLPTPEGERYEMIVRHVVEVTEHHKLEGKCPMCGMDIATDAALAVQAYDQGKTVNCDCLECHARLFVPGRSLLVAPSDVGRVVVPGRANNRHARRAGRKL